MITFVIATRNKHKVGEIRAILGPEFHYLTLNDFPNAPEVVEDAATFAGNATKKAVELAKWLGAEQGSKLKELAMPPGSPRSAEFAEPAAEARQLLECGGAPPLSIFVLADDSGLEVDALAGAPGVHSARFAALDTGAPGNSATADNNAKLLRLLSDVPAGKRTARFRCVIALTPVILPCPESASPVCYSDEAELQTQLLDGTCEGRIGFSLRGTAGFGYDPLFTPVGYDRTFGELEEAVKNKLSHRARALESLRSRLIG